MSLPAAILLLATAADMSPTPASPASDVVPVAFADVDDGPAIRLTEDRYHPRHSRYMIRPLRDPVAADADADATRLRFTGRKVKLRVPLRR